MWREVQPVFSYCAANDPRIHVGLGSATEVRAVEVEWPDGRRELFGNLQADQIVTLSRSATPASETARGSLPAG